MRKSVLIQEIIRNRTLVYEKRGTEVYALRKTNRATLKEEVEIRVISPDGGISRMFDVTMLGDMDPERVFREIIGCSGLSMNDIKKISKNVQLKHDEMMKSVTEEESLEDTLGFVYEALEDRMKTLEEVGETDKSMDNSVLIKDGCYMMKAGVFKRIAEDIEVNVAYLRKELVSLGFIEVGSGRDAVSVSVFGKKHKLIRVRRDMFKRIFGGKDVMEALGGE